MIKRALISLYNKDGILNLAGFLESMGTEILSTGGTLKYLRENGINAREVSEVTGFEEILDGRLKTLHPAIHGGILAKRGNNKHMETIAGLGIDPIDLVVVNLYPFFEAVGESMTLEEKLEFIDIGGPTMLRAAAKNFRDVIVISDPADYDRVAGEIADGGELSLETRRYLGGKVFNLMSAYDAAISNFLLEGCDFPEYLSLSFKKERDMRYGENPHQKAAYYTSIGGGTLRGFKQLGGKELSYNNLRDIDIAWRVVNEFEEICCCAVKHNTPCGAALGVSVLEAFQRACECDPISIFGGIVALNRKVDRKTAEELAKIFLEVVIAPDFEEEALDILLGKKNLRIIRCSHKFVDKVELVSVDGGILLQERDLGLIDNLEFVTEKKPSEKELEDLIFAMKVVKYVKSNAVVVARDGQAKGIGGGQVNRIWAASEALARAGDGVVLASDAFFPFDDVARESAEYGIRAILQPGGSVRDRESIEICNKNGIAMVFAGMRHFKH